MKKRGITIISTIHSPSSKILNLFDKVIILCEGNLVFDGSPAEMKERLEYFNFREKNKPALEHFMEVIDKDNMRINMMKERNIDNFAS